MNYEELLEIAKANSDHEKRVQEFEPAIIEAFASTHPQYPVLEIGNREGGSAILIAANILKEGKDRRLYTVDIQAAPGALREWLPKLGILWTHVVSSQEDFVKTNKEPWGFVYLDADHDYERVKRDLRVLAPQVAKGCVIAVDDVHTWPELPAFEGLDGVDYNVDEGRDWSNVATKRHIGFWRKI